MMDEDEVVEGQVFQKEGVEVGAISPENPSSRWQYDLMAVELKYLRIWNLFRELECYST